MAKRGRPRKYPFHKLKLGDGFLIPGKRKFALGYYQHLAPAGTRFIARHVEAGIQIKCVHEDSHVYALRGAPRKTEAMLEIQLGCALIF